MKLETGAPQLSNLIHFVLCISMMIERIFHFPLNTFLLLSVEITVLNGIFCMYHWKRSYIFFLVIRFQLVLLLRESQLSIILRNIWKKDILDSYNLNSALSNLSFLQSGCCSQAPWSLIPPPQLLIWVFPY